MKTCNQCRYWKRNPTSHVWGPCAILPHRSKDMRLVTGYKMDLDDRHLQLITVETRENWTCGNWVARG